MRSLDPSSRIILRTASRAAPARVLTGEPGTILRTTSATYAEKSTVAQGKLNAVPSQGGGTATLAPAAAADAAPASDIKFCSIDNPDCEACQ